MRPLRLIPWVLAAVAPALPQNIHVSFGAVGGAPFSRGAPDSDHDESPRYTIGPAFGVSFREHFGVEFNALYRRLGGSGAWAAGIPGKPPGWSFIVIRTRANSWEFPILGKYYFGRQSQRGRLFLASGCALQRSWTTYTNDATGGLYYPNEWIVNATRTTTSGSSSAAGVLFGGGIAWRNGPVTIMPSFRYTRWGDRSDGASQNQAEILLGLWF